MDLAFLDGTNPGNMALARSIARAVGLSLDDALAGKAPPRKAPALSLVTPPKRKGGASCPSTTRTEGHDETPDSLPAVLSTEQAARTTSRVWSDRRS
ncbi:hypothetical protein [Polyangium mundeleinium]|uniref:Uncharacterized protein n=1 Tax=Polyangium mundeleinium TaxID=2995306 RepID=A0ABT5EMQ6_9BACT|nr:hypothetical protein [Polyangium mundeleinium]MDC0743120.1 hypothetical protein [Polyangium mundeleinium]